MIIIRNKIILLKVGRGQIQAISKRTDSWPPLCELVKESEFKNKTKADYIPKRTKEL